MRHAAVSVRNALDGDGQLAELRVDMGKHVADGAADHHGDDLLFAGLDDASFTDEAAVAQDHGTVALAEDFLHLVRDVEDRRAARLERGDQP